MSPLIAKTLTFVWIPILIAIVFFVMDRENAAPGNRVSVSVGERSFLSEIADTEAERAQGLSGRDRLCEECAMLFVFERPGRHGFWMPDMRFPIDIAWIRDRRIIHIERHVPPSFQGVLHPPTEATEVLETAAGALDTISIGDEAWWSVKMEK